MKGRQAKGKIREIKENMNSKEKGRNKDKTEKEKRDTKNIHEKDGMGQKERK